ncbi:hypothetical protein OROMI_030793 [Orobanche minor]
MKNAPKKDEIVKSVMHLKNAEIEEGYTKDAVISRQLGQNYGDLLVDVMDKLLFETEYAGNFKDKQQLNLLTEFLGLGCLVLCAFFRRLATYGIHVFYCFNLVYMLTQLSGGSESVLQRSMTVQSFQMLKTSCRSY